jgi:hypothetical protein
MLHCIAQALHQLVLGFHPCTAANGNTVTVSLPLPGASGLRQYDNFDVSFWAFAMSGALMWVFVRHVKSSCNALQPVAHRYWASHPGSGKQAEGHSQDKPDPRSDQH